MCDRLGIGAAWHLGSLAVWCRSWRQCPSSYLVAVLAVCGLTSCLFRAGVFFVAVCSLMVCGSLPTSACVCPSYDALFHGDDGLKSMRRTQGGWLGHFFIFLLSVGWRVGGTCMYSLRRRRTLCHTMLCLWRQRRRMGIRAYLLVALCSRACCVCACFVCALCALCFCLFVWPSLLSCFQALVCGFRVLTNHAWDA